MNLAWFRRKPDTGRKVAAKSAPGSGRLEVLSSAVRDTLRKHGIPQNWLGAETVPAKTPSHQRGVHLRLVVKNASPVLLAHLFALQRTIFIRLNQLDPDCLDWLQGTSWRIDVPLGADKTELPGPEFWLPAGGSGAHGTLASSSRELVSRTFEAGDRAFARTTWEAPEFSPTQPMAR